MDCICRALTSVGKVHARNIHASSNELAEVLNSLRFRSNGTDEFSVHCATRWLEGTLLLEADGQVVFEGSRTATPHAKAKHFLVGTDLLGKIFKGCGLFWGQVVRTVSSKVAPKFQHARGRCVSHSSR